MPKKCVTKHAPEHVATMDAVRREDDRIPFVNVKERDAFLAWARAHKLNNHTANYALLKNELVHVKRISLRARTHVYNTQ